MRPAADAADEPQGRVDARGDTLAGDEVAVADVPGVPHDRDVPPGGEGIFVALVGGHELSPGRPGSCSSAAPVHTLVTQLALAAVSRGRQRWQGRGAILGR